jgi:hypothetical protein
MIMGRAQENAAEPPAQKLVGGSARAGVGDC